ncbi:monooxygenase (plasmid) [Leisingera sp. S132]|uniref:monooxygenase n=1 Tax=Leisingera sp. S132 TaxID=2867016 RepID=UPI0021A88015|nr:monooxygenase [Leisingera sp. S132]UWQ81523.1 monooxygenase [Leisingera sp. S132]
MSTQKIWDIHLTYDGPVTEEFLQGAKQLAESIAQEPGVVWKIWTHEAGTNHFGSTYLFKSLEHLEAYKAMHIPRLNAIGIEVVSDHVFDVMEELSQINRAPVGTSS